ncbi:MAG: tRNA uridine-5-carboxymethylaminomethyl(34) synthesis enzyme MnmG [Thermotogota bacterium]|nr:tRNA uridine-5-carboxymethylaminomethyl(34) synthesis enzyme MnmG [Thermotogota bacterium]
MDKHFDVIVVGAGHAGVEAALVSARLGKKTLLLNLNIDTVAWAPCNPSVGGPAKGVVIREIDALGGQMAKNTDATMTNIRMLNTSKGPAVHALRAQIDKYDYSEAMTKSLMDQNNLYLRYGLAEKILVKGSKVMGIKTHFGEVYTCQCVVITAGTFIKGKIFVGPSELPAGRLGEFSADLISDSIQEIGLKIDRFKTGTPARIKKTSINFQVLEKQTTSDTPLAFSFFSKKKVISDEWPVYITRTNPKTHKIIQKNIHFSPLYGDIKLIGGIGPRYCPSIEDKVLKFNDRDSHQLFIEPETRRNEEYYIGGLSTSLPFNVQEEMIHSIQGLENAQIVRPAYAVEYDYILPEQLTPYLETKSIGGLFFAGQVNGTSGYEEAAGQGFIAGLNAVLKIDEKEHWFPKRNESYLGVLIDDLVTKGTDEPYRLLTSRAEYRLLLRHDNAHLRLAKYGYRFGLIPEEFYRKTVDLEQRIKKEVERLSQVPVRKSNEINDLLVKSNSSPLKESKRFIDLLKRPDINYTTIKEWDDHPIADEEVIEQVDIEIQYEGYIERSFREIKQFEEMENFLIPSEVDYAMVENLATEAKQKLERIKPSSVGQASRIPGINPADIANIIFFLRHKNKGKGNK